MDFDPTGNLLATASDDKSVKIWRVKNEKFVTSFATHTNWVRSAKFSPDGQLVASCGDDKSVRIHDMNSGKCVRCFTEVVGIPRQVAWHPDGNMLAVALNCNRVKIFDLVAQELIQLYHVHARPVNDVAFHPNGNFLLTGSDDETMKILDLLEGRPIYTLTGHMNNVTSVAFNHDGSQFLSVGADKQLLIWTSNLHTFDFSAHEAKAQLEASGEEDRLIDPRQSLAYTTQDENLQVHTCPDNNNSKPPVPKETNESLGESTPDRLASALRHCHLSSPNVKTQDKVPDYRHGKDSLKYF